MDRLLSEYGAGSLALAERARLRCLPAVLPLSAVAELLALDRAGWDVDQAEPFMMPIIEALAAAIERGDLQAGSVKHDQAGGVIFPFRVYCNRPCVFDGPPGWEWSDSVSHPTVHRDDFRRWLEQRGEPLPAWWFGSDDSSVPPGEGPPVPVALASRPGRREQQLQAILAAVRSKGWNPLAIPIRGKAALQRELCEALPALFTAAGFRNAWLESRRRGLVRMASHEKHVKR